MTAFCVCCSSSSIVKLRLRVPKILTTSFPEILATSR